MVVEELCSLRGGDVATTFEEASGEDGDCVGVRFDDVDEHFGECDFFGEGVWVGVGEGLDRAEGLLVVVVDCGDVCV